VNGGSIRVLNLRAKHRVMLLNCFAILRSDETRSLLQMAGGPSAGIGPTPQERGFCTLHCTSCQVFVCGCFRVGLFLLDESAVVQNAAQRGRVTSQSLLPTAPEPKHAMRSSLAFKLAFGLSLLSVSFASPVRLTPNVAAVAPVGSSGVSNPRRTSLASSLNYDAALTV